MTTFILLALLKFPDLWDPGVRMDLLIDLEAAQVPLAEKPFP